MESCSKAWRRKVLQSCNMKMTCCIHKVLYALAGSGCWLHVIQVLSTVPAAVCRQHHLQHALPPVAFNVAVTHEWTWLACRTPIVESSEQLSSNNIGTSMVASRQTILAQSLMQQQQSWQKQSLPGRSLQRQAALSQHAKMLQLSHWGSPSRLQSGSMLWRAQGYRQHAPIRSSLMAITGLQRLCFGSLPF